MAESTTDSHFDDLSWHDNIIYGLRLDVGDSMRSDFRSDLVLDIDHIVEWVRATDGAMRFRVAPATLTFHDVSDLSIAVDFGDSGGQTMINELSIAGITREPVADQKVCLDRTYYRWRIALNWPQGGAISFCASSLTQTLRAEPVLLEEQRFSVLDRPG
jgi:hypothetical protein